MSFFEKVYRYLLQAIHQHLYKQSCLALLYVMKMDSH